MKKLGKTGISLILGAVLLLLWLYLIDLKQTLAYFKNLKLLPVVVAMGFYLSSFFLRSLRWRVLLLPVKKLPQRLVFAAFMSGTLLNYLIPIRAGELAKSLLLKKKTGLPTSQTLPTVFIDKLFDLLPVVLLFCLLPFLKVAVSSTILTILAAVLGIFFLLLLLLIIAITKKERTIWGLKKVLFWLPGGIKASIHRFLELFIEGMGVIKHSLSLIPAAIFITLLALLTDTLYMVYIFKAFSVPLSFLTALFAYTLINLSYILPTPPAQIGSNEMIWVIIYSATFGFNINLTSAIVLFVHGITGLLIVIAGIAATTYLGLTLRETFKPEPLPEERKL